MQYLTKNFYSKKYTEQAYDEQSNNDKDVKNCVKKLNQWLDKPEQQDVKIDSFRFGQEWSIESEYITKLTVVYHHE